MDLQNSPVSAHHARLAKTKWKGAVAPAAPDTHKDLELGYLIDWYERIRRQTPRGFDNGPILFTEMEAFARLNQCEIDPFDLDTLEKLDAVWSNCLPKRSQS